MRAILTYHSIDDSGSPISVSPAVFREHVQWMASGHVRVLPIGDLVSDPHGPDAVALTFDDGFANFETAAAVLAEHGLPATLFIVTGHVGGMNDWGGRAAREIPAMRLLSWDDIARHSAAGVRIGAHTHRHPDLTTIGSVDAAADIDKCIGEIRSHLGVEPNVFAYPYGAHDTATAALAAGRFRLAVTTRFDVIRGDDPRELTPRLDMYYFRRSRTIDAWGSPGFQRRLMSIRTRRKIRRVLAREPR